MSPAAKKIDLSPANDQSSIIKSLREEYEAIINSIYDEILVADRNGVVMFVNKACERLYNKKSGELIGLNVKELAKQGLFSPSITDVVLKTRQTETILQTTKTGKKMLVTAVPIMNEKNEVVKVVSNSREMTELLSLRKELDEKERLIQLYTREIKKLTTSTIDENLLYVSAKMENISSLIHKVSASDLSILLLGESGVGKTMVANVIHNMSHRRNGLFQVINCSAIPETLLESELFGYVKGAFTGATSQGKTGLFELAKGGTIFLDEIGDISPQLQVKLLQVLQDQKFRKIGGVTEINADVRIITATNQDLMAKIKNKQFREDLYYRINGISIQIPPLRDRKEDIGVLAQSFLEHNNLKYGFNKKLSSEVVDLFYDYPWPGNIRELKSVMERICLVSDDDLIVIKDLPENMIPRLINTKDSLLNNIYPLRQAMEMVEKELFKTAFIKYKNSYKVAEVLGISQPTAYRKLKKYITQFIGE
jgi:PAS domain S-box-containing protein